MSPKPYALPAPPAPKPYALPAPLPPSELLPCIAGEFLHVAKAVSDGGVGGMITLSEASFHALPCAAKRSACPHCILHMGEYSMEGKEGPSGLLLALPLDLIAR